VSVGLQMRRRRENTTATTSRFMPLA
jgi:hypothetical protein